MLGRAATDDVFVKLGIADDLKPKIKLGQTTASESVVHGDAAVGTWCFQQASQQQAKTVRVPLRLLNFLRRQRSARC
jgi:hypothetical protein